MQGDAAITTLNASTSTNLVKGGDIVKTNGCHRTASSRPKSTTLARPSLDFSSDGNLMVRVAGWPDEGPGVTLTRCPIVEAPAYLRGDVAALFGPAAVSIRDESAPAPSKGQAVPAVICCDTRGQKRSVCGGASQVDPGTDLEDASSYTTLASSLQLMNVPL